MACRDMAGPYGVIMPVRWEDYEEKPGATPAYVQLADFIEARIRAGDLRPGDQVPAERRLADLTGHSPETCGKAKRLLKERGVVDTSPGRGTFVL